ncbi:MAG: hypothetical protein JNK05_03395 [Myxococcales bacterium]|nr:hypothetical protein [Myxococcales bacterium]
MSKYSKNHGSTPQYGHGDAGHTDPADLANDVAAIRDQSSDLLQRLSFSTALDALNQRHAKLQQIEDELRRLRSRNFVFWPNLEQQLGQAKQLASRAMTDSRNEAQRASQQLRGAIDQLARNASSLASRGRVSDNQVDNLAAERDRVESQIAAVEQRIEALTEPFTKLVDTVAQGVAGSHWTMDQFDQACFRPRAEEHPLAVAAAHWEDCPQGACDGMLYITDLVLRFERTAGQRSLAFERAMGHIGSSDDSERGWIMKDEVLTLSFHPSSGAPQRATLVMKSADSKSIDDFIERARSGQLVAWMVPRQQQANVPIADTAKTPVRWPNECDHCGATIAAPVRGQMEVVCAYCKKRYPVEFA